MRKWLYVLCLGVAFSCYDKRNDPKPESYWVTEDFEGARKDAYAAGELQLRTGVWELDDALIWGGAAQADAKNGERALRIRESGHATTTFEIANLQMIYLKHGVFGADKAATWKIQVAPSGSDFTDLSGEITTAAYTLKLDSFAVSDTGKVRLRIVKTGGGRLNIDDLVFRGIGESGIVLGEPGTDQDGEAPPAHPPRGVEPGDDAPPASGDNSNLLFGNPSNATADLLNYSNYLIDHHYFVLSYNRDRGTPNWVSWHLDATHITGDVSRQDNFASYLGIPASWYAASHASYTGSGFDRGHNCPSADRTSSYMANSSTFLMTNMIPQAPKNNGGPWVALESYVRDQVREGMEAYVIMGSYGEGGEGNNGAAKTIADGKIIVPARLWKVALLLPQGDNDVARVDANTTILAVDMPNTNAVDNDWKRYRVSVDHIEQQTGLDLFSQLSDEIQHALESAVVVDF